MSLLGRTDFIANTSTKCEIHIKSKVASITKAGRIVSAYFRWASVFMVLVHIL